MKRKILPVIVALLLIAVIGGVWLGGRLYDRYSYSRERADLDAYFQVSGEQAAIILQDEMVEEKAVVRDGICYFDLATVHKYFNEIFYADRSENLLLYTTAVETYRSGIGESSYSSNTDSQDYGYAISFIENDTVYIAADYVKKFTNLSYEIYDRHVQVYTQWGEKRVADVNKDTWVRELGGVKSPILRDLSEGEQVEILDVPVVGLDALEDVEHLPVALVLKGGILGVIVRLLPGRLKLWHGRLPVDLKDGLRIFLDLLRVHHGRRRFGQVEGCGLVVLVHGVRVDPVAHEHRHAGQDYGDHQNKQDALFLQREFHG